MRYVFFLLIFVKNIRKFIKIIALLYFIYLIKCKIRKVSKYENRND